MSEKRRWLLLALALVPVRAAAQGLPCAEFRVNTVTKQTQASSDIAADAVGNFVVVWIGEDASEGGIFGQRFDATGTPRGSEFQVNTYTTGPQLRPRVASDALGNFVVVWGSYGQDGQDGGVYGQRFDASGAPQGPEFLVNSHTTESQFLPRVASSPGGDFVVAWANRLVGEDASDVFARRFDPSGTPLGPELMVNTYTTGVQGEDLDVAMDSHGNFMVVWNSQGQDRDGSAVFGQGFNAAGVPQGPEFLVSSYTTTFQGGPAVASDPGGTFVVVWDDVQREGAGAGSGVFGRRFTATGTPVSPEFHVNTYTTLGQFGADVSVLARGDFVVTWISSGQDGDGLGVFGRRFTPLGTPLGPEFRVNTSTALDQTLAAVAPGAYGAFTVTWTGAAEGSPDVFASLDCARLYTVPPCRLIDTRDPADGPPLAANTTRIFPITGRCSIPAAARAVALNVTAVNPTDSGDLRLAPAGPAVPLASTVNFVAGRTRANNAVVLLGLGGQVAVKCDMPVGSQGQTGLLLDVFGYFAR